MGMRAEIYKGVTRALSRALRTPQYIILFVSDSCWMKCSHCWFNEDWKAQNLTGKRKKAGPLQAIDGDDREDLIKTNAVDYERLSFDELERMAESIDMITFLTITGGEAFVRKDIVEITEMFAKKTRLFRYQIPTSGFVTDLIVTKTERMLQVNSTIPFRVDVSLDGTEETHDRIRNMAGSFQRVLTTVRELNKLKRKYAHFDVGIISTISKQNQHEVEAMSKIAAEANPDGEWMVNITRRTQGSHGERSRSDELHRGSQANREPHCGRPLRWTSGPSDSAVAQREERHPPPDDLRYDHRNAPRR